MKSLVLAEKPSVAGDIARALGGCTRHGDYFESGEFIVSSAVGHLLELEPPEGVEPARGKWSLANLPVIPPRFDLKPLEKTESRLKLLVKLIKRKDVTSIINACDAGREGELIFRNIVRHAGADKPVRRLWLQSMTPAAIRDGFQALRADEELRPLAAAAESRAEADWLVGINGTRAFTALNSTKGGFFKTPVGRVQTPTLAILVEREERIKQHTPRDYWELHATFAAAAGAYPGRWFDETLAKEREKERRASGDKAEAERDAEAKPERLWDAERAQAIRDKCLGKPGVVFEESKPATQLSPLLYDLTSLQREANGRFGFSARNTLGLAQALYERHKALTYPRTDSRALPEDYAATVRATLGTLKGMPGYARFAGEILQQGWVRPNKRIFNNAKVSDHFAIIPTAEAPKNLSEPEAKLYDLVVKRFLAVFYPAAEFLVTTRVTRVEEEPFKSEGRVLVKAGWKAVYGQAADDDETPVLAAVSPGETVATKDIEAKAFQTKPPPRFSEATLLSAMEGAGKLVEDEELREAMSARGLGTPATRAAIIEGLIYDDYVNRNGRELQPTAKAFQLLRLLRGLEVPELCRPELTGDWEFKLRRIEHGQMDRAEFMGGIQEMTRHIVSQAKSHNLDTIPGDFGTLQTPCPLCGGKVHERFENFACEKCAFVLRKLLSGRLLEPAEADELLAQRHIGPLQGFRSRLGRPFAAVLKLGEDHKILFDFGQDNPEGEAAPDFTGQEPLGICPKCGGRVFEHGMVYTCEKNVGPEKSCTFRSGRVILQRQIAREEMAQLLGAGRTPLLRRFISKKGRPFDAHLVWKADETKVAFEFAPRASARVGSKRATKDSEPAAPPEGGVRDASPAPAPAKPRRPRAPAAPGAGTRKKRAPKKESGD